MYGPKSNPVDCFKIDEVLSVNHVQETDVAQYKWK